jgi:23S rRNA pseudouridine1911/1915/1917 synthase
MNIRLESRLKMLKTKTVFDGEELLRLDVFVSSVAEVSRSRAATLIEEKNVIVNDKAVSKNYKLHMGDMVEITVPEPLEYVAKPEDIPLDIVYEDEDLLVVNKPKGMVVHPAAGNFEGTLVNALMFHCKDSLSGINGVMRPGIVHRIDKNTSGLLMVAKNDFAHNFLAEQIKEHSFTREYEAIVYGNVKMQEGTIDAPIARHPQKRKQMAVVSGGRRAVTHYKVIDRLNGFTHLRLKLETGRTHQIRVHMAYLGFPVAGDEVYGPKKVITSLGGQCLHAKKIGFIHPKTQEYMEFESDLPDYFKAFLKRNKV